MFEERPSPVVARAEAARKLPRTALLTLLIVFIIPGLITRDFWNSQELSSFAVALTMAQGSIIDWALPNIEGSAFYAAGPLSAWLAAICIKLFGWLIGAESASRLSVLLWFALATSSIWYGTWYLARRGEAQPVVLAFGGQATPKDFGRVVADGALLLFIATFGLFIPLRELAVDTALLAIFCAYFFSLAYSLHRPSLGPILTGCVIAASVWTADFATGLALLIIALLIHARVHAFEPPFIVRASTVLLVSVGLFFVWPIFAVGVAIETVDAWFDGWWATQLEMFSFMTQTQLQHAGRDFLWFLWPLWPFACFALYAFRKQLNRTHIKLPLFIFVGLFISTVLLDVSENRFLMTLTAPMCVLAAFGLMSVHRTWANVLDWFSASVFTLGIATLWAYYAAWHAGVPPKMVKSITNLAPNADPFFHGLIFVMAFGITLLWIALVLWRMNRHTVVAWKGPWMAATGITTLAVLCVYLFAPAIDDARSYRPIAQKVMADFEAVKTKNACLSSESLTPTERTIFTYYGLPLSESDRCQFHFESQIKAASLVPTKIINTYSRPREPERFILLRD